MLGERQFQSKADANLFESGCNSITAQFRRAGACRHRGGR